MYKIQSILKDAIHEGINNLSHQQGKVINAITNEKIISKLLILNLDSLKEIIKPLYSNTGRPSNQQAQIFRSFIIMNHLNISLDEWVKKVKLNYILRTIAGFDDKLPAIASYYDFSDRLINIDDKSRMKNNMKERTAAERVNNRILHNYGIENAKPRGKKKISFLTMIAGFNVHLSAQIKHLTLTNKFDFRTLFNIKNIA